MKNIAMLTSLLVLAFSEQGYSANELKKVAYAPKVEVVNAWARPQAEGKNTAIYLELVNHRHQADDLITAHCNNCEQIEFHTNTEDNGVMHMQKVGFIQVPQNGNKVLKPGGMHIMCIGLNKSIREGDVISVNLNFKNSGAVTANVPVKNN